MKQTSFRHLLTRFSGLFLAAGLVFATVGCSSVELPGSARYFSNQPGGEALFKVAFSPGGPTLSARTPDGKWTPPRALKPLRTNEPPLSTTPGLAAMVKSAHSVDDYVFMEFQPDAKVGGRSVPSRYFLLPGGFAYTVSPR